MPTAGKRATYGLNSEVDSDTVNVLCANPTLPPKGQGAVPTLEDAAWHSGGIFQAKKDGIVRSKEQQQEDVEF